MSRNFQGQTFRLESPKQGRCQTSNMMSKAFLLDLNLVTENNNENINPNGIILIRKCDIKGKVIFIQALLIGEIMGKVI